VQAFVQTHMLQLPSLMVVPEDTQKIEGQNQFVFGSQSHTFFSKHIWWGVFFSPSSFSADVPPPLVVVCPVTFGHADIPQVQLLPSVAPKLCRPLKAHPVHDLDPKQT
jgi:hypothetical protein